MKIARRLNPISLRLYPVPTSRPASNAMMACAIVECGAPCPRLIMIHPDNAPSTFRFFPSEEDSPAVCSDSNPTLIRGFPGFPRLPRLATSSAAAASTALAPSWIATSFTVGLALAVLFIASQVGDGQSLR